MKKIFSIIAILIIISACRNNGNNKKDLLSFTVHIDPSFDERAEIVLSKTDDSREIQFLIRDRQMSEKTPDTFYYKTILLSKDQFDACNTNVIQKTRIKQPPQWTGCCDGMPVSFILIQGNDTSKLYFRSPDIKNDSIGYKITKATIDNLRTITNDSIINDYLNDVESYMDESIRHIHYKENRAINKLRKIEYSRILRP